MPRKRGAEYKEALRHRADRRREKTVEEREYMPDKPCGKCKKFFHVAAGRGHCTELKAGSDILEDPPVYNTDSEFHYRTSFNRDGGKCKFYDEMELIDTDISQSNDPMFSRHQRQMQK